MLLESCETYCEHLITQVKNNKVLKTNHLSLKIIKNLLY
jgi:hypothetical protein